MKRLTTLALVSLVALLATGLAIAHNKTSGKTEPVAATFTATSTDTKSEQCTGTDGAYTLTRGTYEGTTAGDTRLAGKLSLKLRSSVNAANNYGWTKGSFKVRDAAGKTVVHGSLTAVNSPTGVLNGMLHGKVKDGGPLLANFTATVAADGKSVNGELGTSSGQNTAVLLGGCSKSKDDHDKKDGDKKKDDGDKKDARRK